MKIRFFLCALILSLYVTAEPLTAPADAIVENYCTASQAQARTVRGATMESDAKMLMPYEYHADTTLLFQLMNKGHHGVKLDAEGWAFLLIECCCTQSRSPVLLPRRTRSASSIAISSRKTLWCATMVW